MIKLENITIKEATEISEGNEQLFKEMTDKFRQWLQQQMHLPQEISDNRLQKTILCSKFNLEKAKKRIDSLYTLRTLIPEFFADYDPLGDDITRFHKCMKWVPLPKLTPEKYRVTCIQFLKDSAPLFSMSIMMKYYCMLMDVRTEDDMVTSDIVIWDYTNITLSHLLKYTPTMLRKVNLIMEAYGTRLKAIYMLNCPPFIDQLIKMIKLFMAPRFYERVHVFESGVEALEGIIPKSILPVEFGGEELSMDILTDILRAKLEKKRDWLLEQERLKIDESLRNDGMINTDELFGVAGAFRKLEID